MVAVDVVDLGQQLAEQGVEALVGVVLYGGGLLLVVGVAQQVGDAGFL